MASASSNIRKDGGRRRRKPLVVKERNISSDEFMAASIGDVEWLHQTLRDGRSASNFDKNGLSPIHLAALHGRLNCLQLLVETYDVDVNSVSATGWTPLQLCINRETGPRALKCMNYLLANEADVNWQNDDYVTAVHQAASEGLLECLKILIENKADLNVQDVRGHLPIDLTKLWSHKKCFRIIRAEMWKRGKQEKAEEIKQLGVVRKYYKDLQKEAVHQLKNEQDFYGGVAFGNWLTEKGLPENLKETSVFQRERYPEMSTDGLSKRLRTSGGLDDCAQRMELSNHRQQKRQSVQFVKTPSSQSEKQNLKQSTTRNEKQANRTPQVKKVERQPLTAVKTERTRNKISQVKQVVRVERETESPTQRETWEGSKAYTPYSEMTTVSERPSGRPTRWNFSTNLNSEPVTNIKNKDLVALSIYPDEIESVLPQRANLSVMLEAAPNPKIKMMVPGGRIQSADIRMPRLAPEYISDTLSGMDSARIRIPQEFKAVHVYDIKKKKQPDLKPIDEVGMHLSFLGDQRLLRKSSSMFETNTLPPLNNFNRALDTLNRMNPTQAFLA